MMEINLRQIVKDGMTHAIIEGNDEVRIVWYFNESIFPYSLQTYDQIKGWVPLMIYDSVTEALAGMERLIESQKRKEDE